MVQIHFLEAETIDVELPWPPGYGALWPDFQVIRGDTMATKLIWNGELVNTTENRGESARAVLDGCESLCAVGYGDARRNMVDHVEAACPICLEDYAALVRPFVPHKVHSFIG